MSGASAIGAGIIGLGVGERHARAALAHHKVGTVLLCDLDREKAEALARTLAREFPGKSVAVADSDASLIDDPRVDVVVAASHDDAHFPQVMRALAAGKHVFAEKPLCQDAAQAAAIRAALRLSGAKLSSNMVLRSCPLFAGVRQAFAAGEFGAVSAVDADYLWGRAHKLTRGWRGRMERYSIVQGAASHMIDLVLWLTGERPCEVQALGNNLATRDRGFPFNDSCALNLRFPSGLFARIGAFGGCAHPHFHRLAVYGELRSFVHEPGRSVWIERLAAEGSEGNEGRDMAERPAAGAYPAKERRGLVLSSFLDEVCGLGRALAPQEEVFETMAVCFAADTSLREGRPAAVTYEQ